MTRTSPEYHCSINIRRCNAADFVYLSLGVKVGVKKQINRKENVIKIKHVSTGLSRHVSWWSYWEVGVTETVPPGPGNSEGTVWALRFQKARERKGREDSGRGIRGKCYEGRWLPWQVRIRERERTNILLPSGPERAPGTSVLQMWNLLLKSQKLLFFPSPKYVWKKSISRNEAEKEKNKTPQPSSNKTIGYSPLKLI